MRTRMPRGRSGRTALGGVLAAVSLALLWVAGMAPSGRLGLAALALLAAAPRLQKRYGPQWLCRLWVTLAVLLLVPLHALGKVAGVPTPCMDAIITIGRAMMGDEMDEGRTSNALGLDGMTKEQFLNYVNNG